MLNQFLINGYLGCFQSFAITKAFLSVQKMIHLWVYVQGYLEGKSGNFSPLIFLWPFSGSEIQSLSSPRKQAIRQRS